jgi:predicted adenine nucleotide alpha hydrolase (AANH) superfamily ATPase
LKLLLHCCCGPCALLVAEHFRSLGHTVTGWFFNPNLYPPEEYARRAATFAEGAREIDLPLLPTPPARPLEDFLLSLSRRGGPRCHTCYDLRLRETARKAAEAGFEGFSTTLLISPYQDLEAIAEIGAAAAAEAGVEFLFADLTGRYPESCDRARELDLYRQNYCGCLFSALERSERRSNRAIGKVLRRSA